ncbi:MAG: nucleotidyltransferase family protein [Candidatus Marinimicrobia bacterium]|nr:nucleotidyltransferase family protein [Candidatus Neomarinimicrobiota bacterium]
MKAIIPIAGKGTRLLPHTEVRQKALLPVGGQPILDHIIEPLVEGGVTEVSLVVGYLGDQVRDHMARYSHLEVTFIEQQQQQGLGHAVLLALDGGDDPVLIVLGDTIFELDFGAFISGGGNSVGVVAVDDPQRFGIVEATEGVVVNMVEKPSEPVSNLALAGIYRIEYQRKLKEALETLIASRTRTKEEYQLTDALSLMVHSGEVFHTHRVDGWLDCGTTETLLTTNHRLLQLRGGPFIHPEATVERSTVRSTSIMENCRVLDSTLEDCIV